MGYDCDALPGSGLWLDASVCAKTHPRIPIRDSVALRRAVAADRSFKQSLESLRTDLGEAAVHGVAQVELILRLIRIATRQTASPHICLRQRILSLNG